MKSDLTLGNLATSEFKVQRSRLLFAECFVAMLLSATERLLVWSAPPSFAKFSCHISCSCYCKHIGCCRDTCNCRCRLFAFCRIMQTFPKTNTEKKSEFLCYWLFVQACSKKCFSFVIYFFWYSLVQKFVPNSASGLSKMFCSSDDFFNIKNENKFAIIFFYLTLLLHRFSYCSKNFLYILHVEKRTKSTHEDLFWRHLCKE